MASYFEDLNCEGIFLQGKKKATRLMSLTACGCYIFMWRVFPTPFSGILKSGISGSWFSRGMLLPSGFPEIRGFQSIFSQEFVEIGSIFPSQFCCLAYIALCESNKLN